MKTPMSFEQHQIDSGVLRNACASLRLIILHAQDEKVTTSACRALNSISQLRSRLEDVMFRDHPKEATTKVYYGGQE